MFRSYTPIQSFGWDQDDYGKEPNSVYVYVSGLDGVGAIKERVSCDFTKTSFDLKVHDLGGKSYRLLKDNLEEAIDVENSKAVVKKNRVTVQLRKVKGEYGHKSWINLTAKRQKSEATKADPTAGIMDMMKELYEDGDDQMRKTLGEAMLKSREKNGPMGGMGDGLGDL